MANGCEATIARSTDGYVAIAARLSLDAGWRAEVRGAVAGRKALAIRDAAYMRGLGAFLAGAVARV